MLFCVRPDDVVEKKLTINCCMRWCLFKDERKTQRMNNKKSWLSLTVNFSIPPGTQIASQRTGFWNKESTKWWLRWKKNRSRIAKLIKFSKFFFSFTFSLKINKFLCTHSNKLVLTRYKPSPGSRSPANPLSSRVKMQTEVSRWNRPIWSFV
jgi:hypothetical protein